MNARNLPERCYYFKNEKGVEGFVFAEVSESGAFSYGNKTYCSVRIATKYDSLIFAAEQGLDTRYVNVTTTDGLTKVMRDYIEGHYGELTDFESVGVQHW